MPSFINKKFALYIFAAVFLVGLIYLFFNDAGIIKYVSLKSQIKQVQTQIDSVKLDNRRLEAEIDSLKKKIPAKIEQTAREKYNMIRKGETSIKVIEK